VQSPSGVRSHLGTQYARSLISVEHGCLEARQRFVNQDSGMPLLLTRCSPSCFSSCGCERSKIKEGARADPRTPQKCPRKLHRCIAIRLRSSRHVHSVHTVPEAVPTEAERECRRTSSGTKGACGSEARCLSAGEEPYPRCFSGPEPTLHTGVMTACEVILNARMESIRCSRRM